MLTVLGVLTATMIVPCASVIAVLLIAGRVQRARELTIANQVAVTDAIHRELGAVVAPVVKKRIGRGWRLLVTVPFERPAIVGTVASIGYRTLADRMTQGRIEIVLTSQDHFIPISHRFGAGGKEEPVWTGANTSRNGWSGSLLPSGEPSPPKTLSSAPHVPHAGRSASRSAPP